MRAGVWWGKGAVDEGGLWGKRRVAKNIRIDQPEMALACGRVERSCEPMQRMSSPCCRPGVTRYTFGQRQQLQGHSHSTGISQHAFGPTCSRSKTTRSD